MELLIQLLGELLLQVVGEALAELGLHALVEPFQRPPNPWLAALGYVLLGAIGGGLSLLVLGHHLTPEGVLRWLNLLLTPVLVGALMVAMGAWRARKGEELLRINRFVYGYLFALSFGVVRFVFAG